MRAVSFAALLFGTAWNLQGCGGGCDETAAATCASEAAPADCATAQTSIDCYKDCCDLEESGVKMSDMTSLLASTYDAAYTCDPATTDPCA